MRLRKFPIYEVQENMELLYKLVRSFCTTVNLYNLFILLGEVEVHDWFKQYLSGDALDTWESIAVDEDKARLNKNLAQLIDLLIDDKSYTVQRDYLSKIRKPSSMTTRMWAPGMTALNNASP